MGRGGFIFPALHARRNVENHSFMRSPGVVMCLLICMVVLMCGSAAVQAQTMQPQQAFNTTPAQVTSQEPKGKKKADQQAQEQPEHRSMAERFSEQPDPTLAYHDPNWKTFGSNSASAGGTSSEVRAFPFLKLFHAKEYTTTPYSAPGFWAGNFKFKATDANVKTSGPLSGLIHMFKTKTAATKSLPASDKTFASRSSQMLTSKGNVVITGKEQGKIDKEGPGALANSSLSQTVSSESGPHSIDFENDMHALTVDDVRAMLGKTTK